jgi:hypothetical protein
MLGPMLRILLRVKQGTTEDGFEETVDTPEATKLGSPLGTTMGILLGVVVGPDDSFQDPVGKSELTNVGSMLQQC